MAKAVSLSGADLAPKKPVSNSATEQRGDEAQEQKEELVPIQFKMPRSWVREFKVTAAGNEMKLNELLKECFAEYMKAANK